MSFGKFLVLWGSMGGFLICSLTGTATVAAELPQFESLSVQGEVKSGAPKEPEMTYLRFYAKSERSSEDGAQIADICDDPAECDPPDVTISTTVYSALWPFETLKSAFPMLSQNLNIKLVGNCFEDSEEGYVFELREDNEKCVTALMQATTSHPQLELLDGVNVEVKDMKELLQSMKIQLSFSEDGKQEDSPNNQLWGDWFLVSEAKFKNPPFPYPVAGFGRVPDGPSSGTELCIGNLCGSAPFGGIGFLGCVGKEICEPIEPEPDPDPECKTATVDLNLDIHVPEATYQSLIGTSNIWFDLEFKGVDPDKDFIWRLKDFGENK